MISSSAIPSLAARAGLSEFHVLAGSDDTIVRWQVYGVLHVSRIRSHEPVLHVTELRGAVRSPFAFGSHGLFVSRDHELAAWLQQQSAAPQLAALAGARVPWLLQVRPRGEVSRVVFLDPTGGLFDSAKSTFGQIASLLASDTGYPEQPFVYACDADALFDSAGAPPTNVRAAAFAGQDAALRDAAKMHDALMKMPGLTGRPESATGRFNAAFGLIPNEKFQEAVTTFEALAREFPDRAGTAYGQSGAALYFLGRYEEAIVHYKRALELGEDRRMMSENILEAEEAIRKRERR